MEHVELSLDELTCPRCAKGVTERLYGPCSECREALGEKMRRSGDAPVVVAAYVPKMNVTPNQVATKE